MKRYLNQRQKFIATTETTNLQNAIKERNNSLKYMKCETNLSANL